MKLLTPDYYEDNIFNINLKKLRQDGIRLILTDIDNTIVPYGLEKPTKTILDWFKNVKDLGFDVCFLSNNNAERVDLFNKELGYYAIHKANKPLPFSYNKCVKMYNANKNEVVFIGDQLFTDVLGAKLAGLKCILVKPIRMDEEDFQIQFKRSIEKLFYNKVLPKRLGVVGNPIKHSLSPILHKSFYDNTGVYAQYKKYCVLPDELAKYIEYFKANKFLGFNITVPYKQEIIKYLDYVHPDAAKINSVNTVKIIDGKLYGYSTDGAGFVMQFKDGVAGKTVKIIGAGGTTPAIVQSLVSAGVSKVNIYNRTFEKAKMIAEEYDNVFAYPLKEFCACDCDILINTTSSEHITGLPPVDNLDGINPETKVYDTNYKPQITKFMQLAISNGCEAHNGLEMLVNQGLKAHNIWFERNGNK